MTASPAAPPPEEFRPISNEAEYAVNQEAIASYEARIFELTLALHEKLDAFAEQRKEVEARHMRVIDGLTATLHRLRANAHDYWLSGEGAAAEEDSTEKGNWSAEVFSLTDLISAAARDDQWVEYLLPNTTKLNARARKDKRAMYVPGVVPVKKEK